MLTMLSCCTGTWAQSSSDVLNGVFTVSNSGTRVQFSKGNLQYVDGTYRFAEHQYDYFGNNQDWFSYNNYSAPSDGISWYVMSQAEWEYLFVSRTVTNTLSPGARYSKATIDGTYKGVIVFPDNYTHPDGTGFEGNCENATEAYSSTVSLEGWALMEAAGCVFLPAAGYSTASSQVNQAAVYQSTTRADGSYNYTPGFYSNKMAMYDTSYTSTGVSVRFVKKYLTYHLIGSAQELKDFATLVNNGTTSASAKLTADIDLAGNANNQWTPIGTDANRYSGTFDGQGFTIKNLYYKQQVEGVGLFGHANTDAYIKNVRVEGTVDNSTDGAGAGNAGTHTCAGGIIGKSYGATVLNCSFSGSVISFSNVGGLVGWGTATIVNCYNEGTVMFHSSHNQAGGGVHGYDGSPQLKNCYNVGSVINNGSSTYAIGALSYSGSVSNCYSRSGCVQNGNGAGYDGKSGTIMSLDDMKTEAFVTTLNTNVASLRATYPDISEWVQDPVTNLPMLKIFANAVTLNDGDGLTALSAYAGKTCTVTYSRSFTVGKSSTVCLPFAFAKGSVGRFYTFTGITKSGSEYIATMTEYTGANLVANTPYLFTPSATGSVDFSGTYAIPASLTAGSTTSGDWKYLGTYTTVEWTTAPTGIYGFSAQEVAEQGISQGQFVKVGAYVRVKPMRCYLKYKDGAENYAGARGMSRAADEELPETIKVRLIGANGEVTAIGTLQTKTGEVTIDKEGWYSLDGRRIEGKPSAKGIYVNNGKKVIIK